VDAADVLHQGVPGGRDPRGPVALQAAHRPEPGLKPPVISLDAITGIPPGGMQRRGDQLTRDPRISCGPVRGDPAGTVPARSARLKDRRAADRSRRPDTSTPVTWPGWPPARYGQARRPATFT
jgi:hypothetical protein